MMFILERVKIMGRQFLAVATLVDGNGIVLGYRLFDFASMTNNDISTSAIISAMRNNSGDFYNLYYNRFTNILSGSDRLPEIIMPINRPKNNKYDMTYVYVLDCCYNRNNIEEYCTLISPFMQGYNCTARVSFNELVEGVNLGGYHLINATLYRRVTAHASRIGIRSRELKMFKHYIVDGLTYSEEQYNSMLQGK